MTALENASQFVAELDKLHVQYFLQIARPEAFMVSVAIPGERWEIEFFDDGHVELERFGSQGVDDYSYTVEEVLTYFGKRLIGEPEGDGPSLGTT
jgi:hypothetical protein